MAGIVRIGPAYYHVADMGAAVEFYERVLGLPLKLRDGDAWVEFDVGGATLALVATDEPVEGLGGAIVSLRVEGIEAFVATLRERGANVSHIIWGGHERRADVRDPSGNRLVLYEPIPYT
jgi:predicted enzyme related to lactoylglutathione lyase